MKQDSLNVAEEDREENLSCPNRKKFQAELDLCDSAINKNNIKLTDILSSIAGVNREISQINILIKQSREPYRIAMQEIGKKRDKLRDDKFEVERECPHRDMQELERCLARKEKEYRNTVLDAHHERILVTEISVLKKNKATLSQLLLIKKQIEDNDTSLSHLRKKREKCEKIAELKSQSTKLKTERVNLNRIYDTSKDNMKFLISKKNDLVKNYKLECSRWKNKKNRANQYPSTFPSLHRLSENNLINEDELEPFHEQKNDLRLLISYLEKLDLQRNASGSLQKSCSENEEDSADEFTAHFQNLTFCPVVLNNQKNVRRKTLKKSVSVLSKNKKLDNQPISHDLPHFQLFGRTNTVVPATFGVVKAVREKLALLDNKTNEIEWDEKDVSEFSNGFSSCTTSVTDSAFGY
ncbi:unnamed protein product [Auanema sp. JU1783]|nr:unnamed protein product [Auanema sp. JU1783]